MPAPFSMARKRGIFHIDAERAVIFFYNLYFLLRLDVIPNFPFSHSRIRPMNSTYFQKCCWEPFDDILLSVRATMKALTIASPVTCIYLTLCLHYLSHFNIFSFSGKM